MLQFILRKFFTKLIYPTCSRDWYKIKGYKGENNREIFADFLAAQRTKGGHFYNEFTSLRLTRQDISSGADCLDSVLAVPDQDASSKQAGSSLYFVLFQGRDEYYEGRFRDIARLARETGASVLGFNPKGVHCSTGKTTCLLDLVNDGIAAVSFLLQRGVDYNQIILIGNSLGAGVQEMVSEHYRLIYKTPLRQINSNSFRSLSAVLTSRYKMQYLESLFDRILKYSGWGFSPGENFYRTGPYRCHMRRLEDKTIMLSAEYHSMVDFETDYENCPAFYKDTHRWLYDHSQIIYRGNKKIDPHELSLHHFDIKSADSGEYLSVYNLINRYLTSIQSM